MNEGHKRFSYFEGYKAIVYIGIISLFIWNLTDGAEAFMESIPLDSFLVTILFIIYNIVTVLGGLFLIFVVINDVVDSIFENKNKDNPNYKTQKTVILTVIIGVIAIWFFAHFAPKQECLKNITLGGSSVYLYTSKDTINKFKSRNDALDYCMAQRWGS